MNLGIVGSGLIVNEFLSELSNFSDVVNVVAITTRPESFNKNKEKYADEKFEVCESYKELIRRQDIDTVYVAVPNHLHFEYSLKALQNGKHVICEKPFTSTVNEVILLKEEAIRQRKMIFEAITTLYATNFKPIVEAIEQGSIGKIKIVECNYTQYSRRYDEFQKGNILPVFDPEMLGGALMDINVYNIHFVVGLFGKPIRTSYFPNIEQNIDTSGILVLEYPSFSCICTGAKDCHGKSHVTIQGEKGAIQIDGPANSITTYSLTQKDQVVESNSERKIGMKMENEFRAFSKYIQSNDIQSFHKKIEHSILVMEILEKNRM